jgi:hypothetical protein
MNAKVSRHVVWPDQADRSGLVRIRKSPQEKRMPAVRLASLAAVRSAVRLSAAELSRTGSRTAPAAPRARRQRRRSALGPARRTPGRTARPTDQKSSFGAHRDARY